MKKNTSFKIIVFFTFVTIFVSCSMVIGPEIEKIKPFGTSKPEVQEESKTETFDKDIKNEVKIKKIILIVNATIREGPGTEYKIMGEVKKGEELELVEQKVEWVKIKLLNGMTGWVYGKLVRGIKDF